MTEELELPLMPSQDNWRTTYFDIESHIELAYSTSGSNKI